jgi:hypothetical protein
VDAATLAKNINNHPDLKAIGIEAKAVNTSTANAYNNVVSVSDYWHQQGNSYHRPEILYWRWEMGHKEFHH